MSLEKAIKLEEQTWPQVEAYLKSSKKIIWPIGSTEQHGPSGILGIDFLSTQKIAEQVSARTGTLLAPALPFGMAQHHMNFPGTMTLSPITYIQTVTELLRSLNQHGFDDMIVINGHGGNIAPVTSAFSQLKPGNEKIKLKLINWWHLPEVTAYEKEVFGDNNGFHATCGEISVTRFTHPEAYENVKFEQLKPTPKNYYWPMGPLEFRETFPEGVMGSQPIYSSKAHGEKIFELAVQSILNSVF